MISLYLQNGLGQALQFLGFYLWHVKDSWRTFRRERPWTYWTLVFFTALSVIAGLAAGGFLYSIHKGAFGKLPEKEDLKAISHYLASEVYSADSALLGRYYFENRSPVYFEDISPQFIHALLATEDARFFEHNGVDLRAWSRVLFKSILMKDRSAGGGSTISQQLAKNLYPREKYEHASLIINKLKEVFIAMRLERVYSKEEILELYLNTVPFSENTYGIKVAAHRFFQTSPRKLTVSQSAVLVGMLKATSVYNPVNHPERSIERRNLVLDQMARYEYLDPAEADSLKALPLNLNYAPLSHNEGLATYFREHLRQEIKNILKDLRKPSGMAYNVYTDGLKIYTTIDSRLQRYGEEAVKEHISQLQADFEKHLKGRPAWENDTVVLLAVLNSERYRSLHSQGLREEAIDSIFRIPVQMMVFDWKKGEVKRKMSPLDSIKYYLSLFNAGFLALDPNTGAVMAWVGGIDHKYLKYDHVRSRRQVGSTFKPVVYATAITRGIHPCAYIPNELRVYSRYENWRPKNADNKYGGFYSMEGGLINSVNTVTVNLALRSGPAHVAEMAKDLGISGEVPAVPAIALGAVEVSVADMATLYGTFANRGVRPELYYIKRIESPTGEVLIDFEAQIDTCDWKEALTVDEADMINEMLRSAVDRGTARRLRWRYKFRNDLAGKTGTSQNHSDGWFIGYNPQIVAGVWVGAESPSVRFRDLSLGQGANMALPIFANFLLKMNADERYVNITSSKFPKPSIDVKSALNCANVVWPQSPKVEGQEGEIQETAPEMVAAGQ
jgi:penicillin-binding protein 1A